MPKAEINFMPVKNHEKAEWGLAEQISDKYAGMTKNMANKLIDEMAQTTDFARFVDSPYSNMRFVHFEAFEIFMKWKSNPEDKNLMKDLSKIKIKEWKTFWPIEVPLDAEYCSYESIEKYWVDFKKGFAKQIATEMRENRDFSQYILNPTHKTAFFNLLGLRYFMIWKSRNRYKPKKETLAEMLENIKFENQIGA